MIDDALECGPSDVYAFTLPEQLAQMCVIRFRVAGPRDTLNNPSARLNFLCVELQSTDLFRPSLGSVDIYIILGICQQLNYLQNNGHGCWSSFVVSQTCMSDRSPTVSGSSRPSSG